MGFIADRVHMIKPSPTLEIAAKAAKLRAEGRNVIGLGAGEPDFDTPAPIREKAIQAIKDGKTRYTQVDGTPELKKAICAKLARENSLEYTPDQILVSCGAKQVLFNALLATINPDDEVIIPAPYWVSYPDMVIVAGGTPKIAPCAREDDFKLTPKVLEKAITPKTKWLILNSPSNPTGGVYSKEELLALAKVLMAYPHVHVLSDDIYEHILYDDMVFHSLATLNPKLKDRILVVNGVSKGYAMTGWRIGYGAGHPDLIKAMKKLQSQSTSNPCSISQMAAIEALDGPQDFMEERNRIFKDRRDLVVKIFNETPGLICQVSKGAFYVYPSCEGIMGAKTPEGKILNSDTDFADYLLDSADVAVVPGVAFGLSPYLRVSYALDTKLLETACQRIKTACEKLGLPSSRMASL